MSFETSEVNEHRQMGSRRMSKRMQLVTGIYILIVAGTLIFMGAFFMNVSISRGTPMTMTGNDSVVLEPNASFAYNITAVFKSGSSTSWDVGIAENGTHYYDLVRPFSTLTSWSTQKVWASLSSNELFDIWTYTYYPDGRNETYSHRGIGASLIESSDVQAGTYTIRIRNAGSQQMNAQIDLSFTEEIFEKPYFYYAVAQLTVGLTGLGLFVLVVAWRLSRHKV